MLPGFNHNVRYQERVFHVQTEDNGLSQARLVTQVFVDGQLVTLERGSYRDILDSDADEKAKTEQIRVRMQEQHKGQMKLLVSGGLDSRIELLFGPKKAATPAQPAAPNPAPPAASLVPPTVAQAAESLPDASESAPGISTPPPKPAPPKPSTIPGEAQTVVARPPPSATPDLPTIDMPHPALRPTAAPPPADDAARQSHPDFLIELDEEMRRHAPWRPTDAQLQEGQRFAKATSETIPAEAGLKSPTAPKASPPAAPAAPQPHAAPSARPPATRAGPGAPPPAVRPLVAPQIPKEAQMPNRPLGAPTEPPRRSVAHSAQIPKSLPAAPTVPARPSAGRALPPKRNAFPPAGDTIIDMGLPAALKESIERRRAQSSRGAKPPQAMPPQATRRPLPRALPPETEAPTPVDLQMRPRGPRQDNPNDTMLEIDAAELRAQVTAQRARLRQTPPAATEPPTPEHVRPPQASVTPAPTQPPEAKGNIVVVERSLDDVILGYLSTEE